MYKIIGSDQKQYGPVTEAQIRQWITEGRINAQTLIQADGQTDWRPLSTYPEFAGTAQPISSSAPIPPNPYPTADGEQLVNGPGIGLMVVGIICVLSALAGVAGNLFGMGAANPRNLPPNLPPQLNQYLQSMSGTVGLIMNFVGLALGGFITFASIKMRKLESYGMVLTATILSMVPCISPCCCVGLPVGIWILVVLQKPEVKSAFH